MFRLHAALLAFAVAVTPAAPPAGLSAHWNSRVALESAPGQPFELAEIWLSGPRMRIEESFQGGAKTVILKIEGDVYVWDEGKKAGTRMSAGLAIRSGRPGHDYVRYAAQIRSHGKKVADETVDGFACEVFEYEGRDVGKGTFWLAPKLQDFPIRAILDRPVGLPYPSEANRTVKFVYQNSKVRIPGSVPEAKLALPKGVEFQNVSDLFQRGRAPR